MFQLTTDEFEKLKYSPAFFQLRSQIGTSKKGGRRYLPYAFTQEGVAMLSSVLRSPRAAQVNIEIMRAFVRLRQILGSNAELARKLNAAENFLYPEGSLSAIPSKVTPRIHYLQITIFKNN